MGRPDALPMVLGSFFVVSSVSVPLWMAVARRFEKKPLLVVSMLMSAVAMGSISARGAATDVGPCSQPGRG